MPDIVDEWAEAMMTGDPAAVRALYTDNAVFDDTFGAPGLTTSDPMSHISDYLVGLELEEMTPKSVVTSDGVTVVDWTWTGTSVLAGTRTEFSADVVTVFEFHGDPGFISRTLIFPGTGAPAALQR